MIVAWGATFCTLTVKLAVRATAIRDTDSVAIASSTRLKLPLSFTTMNSLLKSLALIRQFPPPKSAPIATLDAFTNEAILGTLCNKISSVSDPSVSARLAFTTS